MPARAFGNHLTVNYKMQTALLAVAALFVQCFDFVGAFGFLNAHTGNLFSMASRSSNKIFGTSKTDVSVSDTLANKRQSILITFDLDDTLFPIQEVVDAANDAQIEAMKSLGHENATMEQCMVQTRAIRQSLSEPITYTDLRKGAIRAELERFSKSNEDHDLLEEQVEYCFNAWLQARHAASELHLDSQVIPALQDLQNNLAASYNLCIAAITNGRGNPLCMTNTLAPYFDFCVSGEDDDVFPHRKPHPEIYKVALQRWRTLQSQQGNGCDDFVSESSRPHLWVHIGDCLANDVGASHDVGAHAIWVAPIVEETNEKDSEAPSKQPSWSTATKTDRQERDLLMQAARSKMSGQITNLLELNQLIQSILRHTTNERAQSVLKM